MEDTQHVFHQASEKVISRDWLLLDNQSAMDQFVNSKFLKNNHAVENHVHVFSNAGCIFTIKKIIFGSVKVSYNLQHNKRQVQSDV